MHLNEVILKKGMEAPDFSMPSSLGKRVKLPLFRGRRLVLYFYPKDDTPGCTLEAQDFTKNLEKFKELNCDVMGVSRDFLTTHMEFIQKCNIGIILASDAEGLASEAYRVWLEKTMYGKKYMGIERSTFLIDEMGKIYHIWRKVKVEGHVDEVLEVLRSMPHLEVG